MTTGRVHLVDPAVDRPASRAPEQGPRRPFLDLPYGLPTAGQVMHRRPPVADQHTSLWGAWELLHGPEDRYLVVVDRHVRPVGVLEARDLALRWPPGPFDAHRVPLHRLLVGQVWPRLREEDDMATVAREMLTAGTEAAPVVDDDGRFVGLVTARLCVAFVAELTLP